MGERAEEIAVLIKACPIETRGDLFLEVAAELRLRQQNYTASLFETIAQLYGITEQNQQVKEQS